MKTILSQLWSDCKYRLYAFLKVFIAFITVLLAWKYVGGAFALVVAFYLLIISFWLGLSKIRKSQEKHEKGLFDNDF